MVSLDITETSQALAVVGGYVTLIGLVSYFIKERLFMSEALLATVAGIIFGPIALGWFDPHHWSDDPEYLTRQITRVIIAIQVLFTGISLPKAYLKREWKSLVTLLGPVMTTAWFICSLLVWGLIPGLTFLESLVIGACVTPTDPVLANSICKGRFAEKHVPLHVRNIIVAEAGANDGLGFPFLFLPLYLILIDEPSHPVHSVGSAIGEWIYNIILYQVLLSCVVGAVIGYVARKLLRFCQERELIDHESFLSFGVALTFFTLGVVGLIGSDDILCCFVVGNSFTWDDWFRVETEDHAFQDVIDQLLNSAIFIYIGAIIPWAEFGNFEHITPWRLVVLGILVMLFRRLPWVMLLSRYIPTLPTWRESAFAGFFGPIGVGAVFYTQVALEVLPDNGTRHHLRAVLRPVNFFLVLTSIVVHGITIPVGKGFQRARTLTQTRSITGLVGDGNNVSRLPPPISTTGKMPDTSSEGEQEQGQPSSTAIRFDLDGQPSPETKVNNATDEAGNLPGILSRPITPPRDSARQRSPGHRTPDIGLTPVTAASRRTRSREPSEVSWIEGEDTVTELADGSLRVERGRAKK